MKERKIFDIDNRGNGISEFGADLFKILVEEPEFAKSNLYLINPNDFPSNEVMTVIGLLKDLYNKTGNVYTYDALIGHFSAFYDSESVEYDAYVSFIEEVKNKVLTDERIQIVKSEFKYLNCFSNMLQLGNFIIDNVTRIRSFGDIERISKQIISKCNTFMLSVEKIGLNETVEDSDKLQGEW